MLKEYEEYIQKENKEYDKQNKEIEKQQNAMKLPSQGSIGIQTPKFDIPKFDIPK